MIKEQLEQNTTKHPRFYAAMNAAMVRVATKIARGFRQDAEAAEEHIALLDAALMRTIADRDHWRSIALRRLDINAAGEVMAKVVVSLEDAEADWNEETGDHEYLSRPYLEHLARAALATLRGERR